MCPKWSAASGTSMPTLLAHLRHIIGHQLDALVGDLDAGEHVLTVLPPLAADPCSPSGARDVPGTFSIRSIPRSIFSQVKPSSCRAFNRSAKTCGSCDSVVSA